MGDGVHKITTKLVWLLALACMQPIFAADSKEAEVVLKPKMRPEALSSVLYSVRTDDLSIYLQNILLFNCMEDFERLPYVVGFDRESTMAGEGERAYVMGLKDTNNISSFSIVVPGRKLIDPCTEKVIGLQVDVIGDAELELAGKPGRCEIPSAVWITNSTIEIDQGARLVPRVGLDLPEVIEARYPDRFVKGFVLSVENISVGVGNYSVVVLGLGKNDGVFQGCVLDLIDGSRVVYDEYTHKKVNLPPFKFGEVLVYKVACKISLAIISYAQHPVHINDIATGAPEPSVYVQ